ncbi:MAG: DUF4922 domain-containing protein [Lachnospiraceae bacterium]|nr:DUF4922 domain-containing protein [Lachnospiraceae bacterium]
MEIYHLNFSNCSTKELKSLLATPLPDYILIGNTLADININPDAVTKMTEAASAAGASVIYSDYTDHTGKLHPLIDYHEGSVRDGFDFGKMILVNTGMLRNVTAEIDDYSHAAFYAARLALSRLAHIMHINESMYSVGKSGETDSQFAYQQADRQLAQREMEEAFTKHLKAIGAYIPSADIISEIEFDDSLPVEASVVIPVRNRVNTIADAVNSALSQITDFEFNVIVVDNHSTDGTTEILKNIAARDPRLIHIIPAEEGHGIGGCWNMAIECDRCGRFAVQLDSDDIYSGTGTLQRIVDKFYEEHCPMVIGSYTLTDFDRNVIPPGLIAHLEWTDDNGRNNALRINGLGAPRAFYTPVARRFRFPDVSYGEDYAMGLAISAHYRIGRIYDSLYLCRRWTGNSDSMLTIEASNRNDTYKDSLRLDAIRYRKNLLASRNTHKKLTVNGAEWNVRLLPGRAVSTKAKVDAASIAARPCFLCKENRPPQQPSTPAGDYEILENPYPVFPGHLTIPTKAHVPQKLMGRVADMVEIAYTLRGYTVFYNGPRCGASAPDHCHFQAVPEQYLPLDIAYPFKRIYLVEKAGSIADAVEQAIAGLPHKTEDEPDVNVAIHILPEGIAEAVIVPRKVHRPKCYPEIGVSPGAIDMFGTIITTSRKDFEAINAEALQQIFADVAFPVAIPEISVGIIEAENIDYALLGQFKHDGNLHSPLTPDSRFKLRDVMIGKDFHWQRNLDLTYTGSLEIKEADGKKIAINHLPVEEYLRSVIASEMSATAPMEFLKAHAVISRSWVLSQIGTKTEHHAVQGMATDEEIIKWYDRENHLHYDVCADDHCQRYQGIPENEPDQVRLAILATRGEVLVDDDGTICDARFSKCCGGVFEEFENCWEPVHHNYLTENTDTPEPIEVPDLTTEDGARAWIMSRPAQPFCSQASENTLRQVLNSYDLETPDFYRWQVEYSVDELSEIIRARSGIDFGTITDLIPLSRGTSGRIYRLKIVGTKHSIIVGKELEIRKWLSRSHLYSSAFIVEKSGDRFILHGAGWGHGVGLCQIGAAVMAEKGYNYRQILAHYYNNAKISRLY